MAHDVVRVALIQSQGSNDPVAAMDRAEQRIADAAAQGANIVCLPELYRSLYFCQNENAANFDLAEPIQGRSFERFSVLAKRLGVVVIAPIFERRAAGLYHNSAIVIDADGSLAGYYRKMHIPHDPLFYEKYYFTPGDRGFGAIDTRFGRIGILICWDQWFPEGARLTALAGAKILFYPTAIAWMAEEKDSLGDAQRDAWRTAQRAHAIANGVFVAACNRVGREDALEFWGSSFIADPFGRVIASAGETETILLTDCHFDEIEQTRRAWPFFRDRRVDAYQNLDRLYRDDA